MFRIPSIFMMAVLAVCASAQTATISSISASNSSVVSLTQSANLTGGFTGGTTNSWDGTTWTVGTIAGTYGTITDDGATSLGRPMVGTRTFRIQVDTPPKTANEYVINVLVTSVAGARAYSAVNLAGEGFSVLPEYSANMLSFASVYSTTSSSPPSLSNPGYMWAAVNFIGHTSYYDFGSSTNTCWCNYAVHDPLVGGISLNDPMTEAIPVVVTKDNAAGTRYVGEIMLTSDGTLAMGSIEASTYVSSDIGQYFNGWMAMVSMWDDEAEARISMTFSFDLYDFF